MDTSGSCSILCLEDGGCLIPVPDFAVPEPGSPSSDHHRGPCVGGLGGDWGGGNFLLLGGGAGHEGGALASHQGEEAEHAGVEAGHWLWKIFFRGETELVCYWQVWLTLFCSGGIACRPSSSSPGVSTFWCRPPQPWKQDWRTCCLWSCICGPTVSSQV